MAPPLRPPCRRKGPPSWRNDRRAGENQSSANKIDLVQYANCHRDFWRWVGEQNNAVNAGGQVNFVALRPILELQRSFYREFGLNLINDEVQAEVIGAIRRENVDGIRSVARAFIARAKRLEAEGQCHG